MKSKMELLAKDIYDWCVKNDLWGDNIIYFDGKAWSSSADWGECKGKKIGDNLYEYGDRDPRDYFEGGNSALSCSFEGPLNYVLNGYTPGWIKFEDEFLKLFSKYGLYFEMYNSWNGNAYYI